MTIQTIHMAQDVGLSQRLTMPLGSTVAEIACASHSDLDGVHAWVKAPASHAEEWIELPRDMWRHVKPRVDDAVMFGYRLHGDWLQTAFAVAAAVLVAVAVPFVGGLLGGGIIGAIGGGLAGAAIGIGAQLAMNALFPSQQAAIGVGYSGGGGTGGAAVSSYAAAPPAERARQFANVESGSNLLARESYLPVVVGTRRISPPEIARPHYLLDNGIQTIQRIFALDGHHEIGAVQVDGAPVEDFESITIETRDGQEVTPVTTFVTKITKPQSVGETLSTFTLDATALVDQEEPINSEPQAVRFTTAADDRLEEIAIRLQIDSAIKSDEAGTPIRIPMRIRFRSKGSLGAWFNLPEMHFVGRDVSTSLKEVRLRWDSLFGDDGSGGAIQVEFFQRVPAASYPLSDASTGDQWQADAHFVAAGGLRDTQNIQGRRNSIRVTLDPDLFPRVEYEWEIVRGFATTQGALESSSYGLDGAINSLFLARNTGSIWNVPVDQGAFVGRLSVGQATAIINRQPCQRPETALLALRAKGQSVRNVTIEASGFVLDWDGVGWNTLTTTSNPATHYRHKLHDYLVYHGISPDLIVNEQFVAWRQECIDRGYEVSAVFAGSSVREVLDAIATAGYARPRFSDGFGIDWFRDRSAGRPVQTFSPRNASISVEWVSPEKPVGIRATFQNADRDFADDEIQINNPFYANFSGYEVHTYSSIAKPSLVERRAFFDMLQAYYQQRRAWVVDCSIEGLICDRGDLVGLVTDLNDDAHSGARIRKMFDTTTFTYDQEIPTESTTSIFGEPNIFDPAEIFTVGEQSVVLVSTPTGTEMRAIVAAEEQPEGWMIRVDQPFSSTDLAGAHFVVGPASRFMTRCIVSDVKRQGEERAQLVLVDEAPEIYQKLLERFGA